MNFKLRSEYIYNFLSASLIWLFLYLAVLHVEGCVKATVLYVIYSHSHVPLANVIPKHLWQWHQVTLLNPLSFILCYLSCSAQSLRLIRPLTNYFSRDLIKPLISYIWKKRYAHTKSPYCTQLKSPAGLLCTESASRLYAYGYQCVGEHEQVSMEVMRE